MGFATLSPDVTLKCGEGSVVGIACVPVQDLIAVGGGQDAIVRIFSSDTTGEPVIEFEEHTHSVYGIVHLFGYVLASVDTAGNLFTWRADTCEVLDLGNVSDDGCTCMIRVDDDEVIVGTRKGEIIRVHHSHGLELSVIGRLNNADNYYIRNMSSCGDILVSSTRISKCHVWNYPNGESIHTFQDTYFVNCVRINESVIVTGCDGGKISVRENDPQFKLISSIDLTQFLPTDCDITIRDISFVSDDIIMATTWRNGIFFVSIKSGMCISHFLLENSNDACKNVNEIDVAIILGDGRICVGGKYGYCAIFQQPSEVAQYMLRPPACVVADVVSCSAIGDKELMITGSEKLEDNQVVEELSEGANGADKDTHIVHLLKKIVSQNEVQFEKMEANKEAMRLELMEQNKEMKLMMEKMESENTEMKEIIETMKAEFTAQNELNQRKVADMREKMENMKSEFVIHSGGLEEKIAEMKEKLAIAQRSQTQSPPLERKESHRKSKTPRKWNSVSSLKSLFGSKQ